jgi:hypothetical protein
VGIPVGSGRGQSVASLAVLIHEPLDSHSKSMPTL